MKLKILSRMAILTDILYLCCVITIVAGFNNFQQRVIIDRNREGICEDKPSDWDMCVGNTASPVSLDAFQASKQPCFCDKDCHKYNDCCINATALQRENRIHWKSPWKCHDFSIVYVYMIQKCPATWTIQHIKDLCEIEPEVLKENRKLYTHLQDMPVQSKQTRLLYRNVFCAMCNNDTNFRKWKVEFRCADLDEREKMIVTKLNEKAIYDPDEHTWKMETRDVNFTCIVYSQEFVKSVQGQFRRCFPSVSSCPANYMDNSVRRNCESVYTSYVYQVPKEREKPWVRYKNFYCAFCHGIPATHLKCEDKGPREPDKDDGRIYATWYPMLLDFNFISNKDNWVGSSSNCRGSNFFEEIYDPVLSTCLKIHCGKLYYYKNGRCVRIPNKHDINGTIQSDCIKFKLFSDKFTVINDSTVYVKSYNKYYHSGEYEVSRKENGTVTEILVCADVENLMKMSSVQGILSEIMLYLSCVSLILHLVIYIILPSLRNLPGKIQICLSSSLLFAQISLLAGPHSRQIPWLCKTFAISAHLSYLCAFFWMNIMGYDILRTFKSSKPRNLDSSKTFFKYSLYAWWTPITIVLFSVIFDFTFEGNPFQPYYGLRVCWISQKRALLVFFALPLAILLSINFLFFILTAQSLHATKKQTKMATRGQEKCRFFLYIKLVAILGLTWIFGFLASLLGLDFLWYPFIIFNGLQGLMIFIGFAMAKKVWPLIMARLRQRSGYLRAKTDEKTPTRSGRSMSSTYTQHTSLTVSKSDLSRSSNISLSPKA